MNKPNAFRFKHAATVLAVTAVAFILAIAACTPVADTGSSPSATVDTVLTAVEQTVLAAAGQNNQASTPEPAAQSNSQDSAAPQSESNPNSENGQSNPSPSTQEDSASTPQSSDTGQNENQAAQPTNMAQLPATNTPGGMQSIITNTPGMQALVTNTPAMQYLVTNTPGGMQALVTNTPAMQYLITNTPDGNAGRPSGAPANFQFLGYVNNFAQIYQDNSVIMRFSFQDNVNGEDSFRIYESIHNTYWSASTSGGSNYQIVLRFDFDDFCNETMNLYAAGVNQNGPSDPSNSIVVAGECPPGKPSNLEVTETNINFDDLTVTYHFQFYAPANQAAVKAYAFRYNGKVRILNSDEFYFHETVPCGTYEQDAYVEAISYGGISFAAGTTVPQENCLKPSGSGF